MCEWRPIPDLPGYEASSDGRVRSLRRGAPRVLSAHTQEGYRRVNVSADGRGRVAPVHRLVCLAFHGPPPPGRPEVRHLNGDKQDCTPGNLAWGTHSENMVDRIEHGACPNTRKTHCPHGHLYDEENTRWRRNQRECRACGREADRRRDYRAERARRAVLTGGLRH